MSNAATKQIIGWRVVNLAEGRISVGEPYPVNQEMAAQSEMRRLNREQTTGRYVVDAILA